MSVAVAGWRRAADVVIALAALSFTVMGIALLVISRNGDEYLNAPQCRTQLEALTAKCYAEVPAVLESASVAHNGKLGPSVPHATVTWPGVAAHLTLTIPYPTAGFYAIASEPRGGRVFLKVWNGLPTALWAANPDGTKAPGAVRTDANPLSVADICWWGGFSLFGAGLVLAAVHPRWRLLPERWRRAFRVDAHPQWGRPVGTIGAVFRDARLRIAVVGLIALNLLDVATSIFGQKAGKYESNPVAWAMVQSLGPLGGFMSLKLPALVAVVLAMTRLPVRVAVIVAYAGCLVMLWVVLANVQLIWVEAAG